LGPVQCDVPQVHSVVRVRVVAEGRKAALSVADARRHREQMAQRDLSELGVALRQLGQVLGHRILDAVDQARVDRDPDERRDERLRGRERRLKALASGTVEVALLDEAVFVDDEEREGLRVAQELVEPLPFATHDQVRFDAGA
jgi:hypothetical protein